MFKLTLATLSICILVILIGFGFFHKLYDFDNDAQKEFATDGCTLFPDASWRECCLEHDKLYWSGGTRDERMSADIELGRCVAEKSGSPVLGSVVFAGVRVFGTPILPSYWRWRFGWSYGRGYDN